MKLHIGLNIARQVKKYCKSYKHGIVDYIPQKQTTNNISNQRIDEKYLMISKEHLRG